MTCQSACCVRDVKMSGVSSHISLGLAGLGGLQLSGAAQLFVPRLLWNVINKANPVSSSINQDYRFRFNGWRWIWLSLKCSAASKNE